jgi:acyl carrier protein
VTSSVKDDMARVGVLSTQLLASQFTNLPKRMIQTMQTTEIEHEIRSYLVDNFLFGRAEALRDDASLLGGVIDSMGAIELVTFLQSRFAITVEDEEVVVPENFASVKNVVAFVERKLSSKA